MKRDFNNPTTVIALDDHSARHETGGADEVSLAGLTILAQDIDFTVEEVVVATTLTANHFLVKVNASGNTTITLPAATSHTDRVYTIINIHSAGTVTIDANGTETIDGEETILLNLQYQYVTIVCDGDEWFIIGGEYVKMEDILNKLLTEQKEQIKLLEKLVLGIRQELLHLSILSDENFSDKDVDID